MTDRVSKKDVDNAFQAYVEECARHGFATEDLRLHHGSKTNGNSYKVLNRALRAPGVDTMGFIGWTRREARETLYTITRVMADIRWRRREDTE